jgi:hypothetical protein
MAEETETGGGGFSLSGLMDRKVFGIPLPFFGGGVLLVAILAYRMFGAGRNGNNANGGPGPGNQFSSTSTYTDPTTGLSTSYTATGNGYLPGQLTYQAGPMPYQQGDVYVNFPTSNTNNPPATSGDWQDSYGQTQINQIQALVGQPGGYNQAEVDDVRAAYNAEVAKFGQAYADANHYSWIGPGNVQAIPKHLTMQSQITTGLPNNPHWGDVNKQATQVAPPANDSPNAGPPYPVTPGVPTYPVTARPGG